MIEKRPFFSYSCINRYIYILYAKFTDPAERNDNADQASLDSYNAAIEARSHQSGSIFRLFIFNL